MVQATFSRDAVLNARRRLPPLACEEEPPLPDRGDASVQNMSAACRQVVGTPSPINSPDRDQEFARGDEQAVDTPPTRGQPFFPTMITAVLRRNRLRQRNLSVRHAFPVPHCFP